MKKTRKQNPKDDSNSKKPLAKISIRKNDILTSGKLKSKSQDEEMKTTKKAKSRSKEKAYTSYASAIWNAIDANKVDLNYALIGFVFMNNAEIPVFSHSEMTKLLIQYGFTAPEIVSFIDELNEQHKKDPITPLVMTSCNEAKIYLEVDPIV